MPPTTHTPRPGTGSPAAATASRRCDLLPSAPVRSSSPANTSESRTSRRGVLGGALVGGAGLVSVVGSSPAASAAGPLPLVKPLNSQAVFKSFGVNALPNHFNTGYRFTKEWMAALASIRASYFRGLYAASRVETGQVVAQARLHGIRWGMMVAPSVDTPISQITATIRHIAANAADRCLYIEGLNEPDWLRGIGPAPAGWHQKTVAVQRAIWEAVRAEPRLSHVTVLGPSLRDVSATETDYRKLADLGILGYLNQAAIHRYPNGSYPLHLLPTRLDTIRRAWPGTRVWITETGYHNALGDTTGHRPVPESVSADYAPASILEAADRGCKLAWFELLDNPDPGVKDLREHNFGLFGTQAGDGPPWRAKPVVWSLRTFLAGLADPGPGFDPPRVPLRVTSSISDVRVTLTAKRSGEVTAHVRRATDCWDGKLQRPITVAKARVTLETATGTQVLDVDHRVTSVVL